MPNGYDASNFPTSFSDPAYDAADQAASSAVGIPQQWLTNIRTKGERSDADQVSSANAATPYQITPDTRQSIIEQTGVDPWLNPDTAAYGAAYLLKQNLGRFAGNPVLATAAYAGGNDQSQWGPKTLAYTKRVTGFTPTSYDGQNPFAATPNDGVQPVPTLYGSPQSGSVAQVPQLYTPNQQQNSPLIQAFNAYKSGQMSAADAQQFEQDVASGNITLPPGYDVHAPAQPSQPVQAPVAPQPAVDAFNSGAMAPADAAQFQKDVQSGAVTLPPGATLSGPPQATPGRETGIAARGLVQGAADTVGSVVDRAKNIIDMPANAIASIANNGGPLNAIDQLFGTRLAPSSTQANLPAGVPQASPAIAPVGQSATAIMDKAGMPAAVTPNERVLQGAAQGAGSLAVPLPGMGLADIPKMIAAGAAGGAVGEAVHQATGNPMLGMAANMLTTVLSPGAASRVMSALAKEVPAEAAAGAARVEPATQASAPETGSQQAAPAAAGVDANGASSAAAAAGATAEQADMAGMMGRMQEGQAQAAAGGVGAQPAGGFVGAQEDAGGVPAGGSADADESAPQPTVNPAASPLASAAQQTMSPEELAASTARASGVGTPFGIGQSSARNELAAQMAADPERLAAAQRLGITDNLQPDHLTTNQAAIELAQAIKSVPGSVARAQEVEGLQQIGDQAQQLVTSAGGTSDLSGLSAQVKGELMNTQRQLDQRAELLYDHLRSIVPAQTPVDASNVLDFVNQRAEDLGGSKNLTQIERMVQSKLTPKEQPITINGQEVNPADLGLPPQTQRPTYALLDDVRKSIGMAMNHQGPFKDADDGLLKLLYGKISEDQQGALGGIPTAAETFNLANSAVQMRKAVEDDMVSLFGRQLGDSLVGKLGTAIAALPKGNTAGFVKLMKAIPPSLRQRVTASGLAYSFGKATRNGTLNFKSYADWMDGLRKHVDAWNSVMANLPPDARKQFVDLGTVSRGIANATRESITTGRIMAAKQNIEAAAGGAMTKVLDRGKQAAVGSAIAGAAHIAGPIGAGLGHAIASALSHGKPDVMTAADKLIVDPAFMDMVKKHAAAQSSPAAQATADAAIKKAANAPTARRFFSLSKLPGMPEDPTTRERWMRGVLAAQAGDDNSGK